MFVAMMHIREMRVVMGHQLMPVPVTALRLGKCRLVVSVLMVRILSMFMLVPERFVRVFMTVLFC